MTKQEKQISILLQGYDRKHLNNLLRQKKVLDQIYTELAAEAARIGKASGFDDPDEPFNLDDFPATKKRINELIANFAGKLTNTIQEGSKREWLLSAEKNRKLVERLAKGTGIDKDTIEGWVRPNLDALEAFQQRKTAGMGLSDRVWNLGELTKSQLELALDLGLGEGKSAADLSRDVREYLREPHKLFRRVRDKHGVLRLSKNAQAYHPGQGVYRSSYKNALRMTATENNMAYRTADHDKWGELDFVIGIHIQLSNNHTLNGKPFHDICDKMVGDYPKHFKFTGWHPFCRCFATPKLADWKEQLEVMKMEKEGKDVSGHKYKGEVEDVPENYKKWIEDNKDRIASSKSVPYFIKDNYYDGKVENGLAWLKSGNNRQNNTPTPIAPPEEVDIVKAIQSSKTTEELSKLMKDRKLVKVFDMSEMPLAEQKEVAETWVKIKDTFELDAVDIRMIMFPSKDANTFMWACGSYVEANTKYWGKDAIEETTTKSFKNCTDRKQLYVDRLKHKESYLKSLEEALEKNPEYSTWYEKEIKKAKKDVELLKAQVDTGMSRHNVFLSAKTMLRDCFTHETGHTIHDQILGGINKWLRKDKYSADDADVLNSELNKLFRKHKKAGGGYLSEYGFKNSHEFFAENTVLYMYAPDKMPADVKHWFDLLKDYAKTGKLPSKEEMPSVKFKEKKKPKK